MNIHQDPVLERMRHANPVAVSPQTDNDHPRADAIRAAITRAAAAPAAPGGTRSPRRRWRARRAVVLALAGAALTAGAAYGASVLWSTDDLPPAGQGPNAFVLPSTTILPDGSASTNRPRYADLPVRPALAFPAGLSYEDAVRSYYVTRQRGEILPPGVALTDPLPAGKVVMVTGGRVTLDPAAPVGYDLTSGLVRSFPAAPAASVPAPALARCQVLLGRDDPDSPVCPAPPATIEEIQERDGQWAMSGTAAVGVAPAAGSTEISLLSRPVTDADRVPAAWRDPVVFPAFERAGADLDQARLATSRDGVRYFAIPAADDSVCLVREAPSATATTCNPIGSLASDGAMLSSSTEGAVITRWGLVADGWQQAELPSGRAVPITDNFLVIATGEGPTTITLTGPQGRRSIPVG